MRGVLVGLCILLCVLGGGVVCAQDAQPPPKERNYTQGFKGSKGSRVRRRKVKRSRAGVYRGKKIKRSRRRRSKAGRFRGNLGTSIPVPAPPLERHPPDVQRGESRRKREKKNTRQVAKHTGTDKVRSGAPSGQSTRYRGKELAESPFVRRKKERKLSHAMAASVSRELQRKQKAYRKELRYKQKNFRRHTKSVATHTERARSHKYYKGSARYLGGDLARSPSDLRRRERKLAEHVAASVGRELQRKQKAYRKELRHKQKNFRKHTKAVATHTERGRPHKYYKGSARYLGGDLARSPSDLRRRERKLTKQVAASVGRELQRKQKAYRKELRYKQKGFRKHTKEVASFTHRARPHKYYKGSARYLGGDLARSPSDLRQKERKLAEQVAASLGRELQRKQKAYRKELRHKQKNFRRHAKEVASFTYRIRPRKLSRDNTQYRGDDLAQSPRALRLIDAKQEKARSVSLGEEHKAYAKTLAYQARQMRRHARTAVNFEGEKGIQITQAKENKLREQLLLTDRRLRNPESIMVRILGIPEDVRKKKKKPTYDKGERAIWND